MHVKTRKLENRNLNVRHSYAVMKDENLFVVFMDCLPKHIRSSILSAKDFCHTVASVFPLNCLDLEKESKISTKENYLMFCEI